MFNLGQNTGAKVTLFYGLRKYFIKKMHIWSCFVRKTQEMCKFFRTSVLNFTGLFKALESSDIFA